MSPKKIQNHVSEAAQFLQEWDKKHPQQSETQRQEIRQYQRIFRLRDHAQTEEPVFQKRLFD